MHQKTPPPIRILSDTTINQIAAGEVIESSASVIKELVENALDAGSTEICVETKGAGRRQIVVSDNGHGMRQEDLYLALERHATSKLKSSDDLFSLSSLGFRGEALPSIASVAKLTLHSCPFDGEGAYVVMEGGSLVGSGLLPRSHGTTVTVSSLFYNVPVRKSFQKSAAAELADIGKLLARLALGFPAVKFEWISEGQSQFILPATSKERLEDRMQVLLGEEFAADLIPLEAMEGDIKIHGFISSPAAHRPNKTGQYLFLNDRSIVAPALSAKVLEGYGHRLPMHRFPQFILYISMPPSLVDVNVHPQKREVRFAAEEQLGKLVGQAVAAVLEKKQHLTASPLLFSLPLEPFAPSPSPVSFQEPLLFRESESVTLDLFPEALPRVVKVIGRFFLVESTPLGDLLVDAQAAARRVYFDKWQRESPLSQALLLPVIFECTRSESELLEAELDHLQKLGMSVRHLGPGTFAVDALPPPFEADDVKPLLYGLLENPTCELPSRLSSLIRRKRFSLAECESLALELFRSSASQFCPQGKTIYFPFNEATIQKAFS